MADIIHAFARITAVAPKVPQKIKSPRKPKAAGQKKSKTPSNHPMYSVMALKAIQGLKEAKGSSRAAILKYIMTNFKVGGDAKLVNSRLKMALRRGVKSGQFKQSKGTGALGRFRLGEKKKGAEKKKRATKLKTAKPKTAAAGTASGEAKKKKVRTTKPKSPKKAKSATAAKKRKSAKPKKAHLSPKKPNVAKKSKKPKSASPKKMKPKKAATAKKGGAVKRVKIAKKATVAGSS